MSDRHFDSLAARFAEKIYGGAKGAIRLAVLQADLAEILPPRPLRVLDVGAGLGHMSLWLAQQATRSRSPNPPPRCSTRPRALRRRRAPGALHPGQLAAAGERRGADL